MYLLTSYEGVLVLMRISYCFSWIFVPLYGKKQKISERNTSLNCWSFFKNQSKSELVELLTSQFKLLIANDSIFNESPSPFKFVGLFLKKCLENLLVLTALITGIFYFKSIFTYRMNCLFFTRFTKSLFGNFFHLSLTLRFLFIFCRLVNIFCE